MGNRVEKRVIIFLILWILLCPAYGQIENDQSGFIIPPIAKSLLIPGLGEYELGYNMRGQIFLITEAVLWLGTAGSIIIAGNEMTNYKAYAANHAGVSGKGKTHEYWVDIGNYLTTIDYNEEHLRWRQFDDLYPMTKEWIWSWDSGKNRKYFKKLRIRADRYKLAGKFIIGGVVLNHILSAVDVLYLQRIDALKSIRINPVYDVHSGSIGYQLDFML
jgi:hypothetical protein